MPRKKATESETKDLEGQVITRTAGYRAREDGEGGVYGLSLPSAMLEAMGATAGQSAVVACQLKDGVLRIKCLNQVSMFD